MPGFIGMPEIILFAIVALLVFGPKRLPEMGRSLGKGLREFKDSVTTNGDDGKSETLASITAVDDTTDHFAHLRDAEPVRVETTTDSSARA